jgi:hypothetical protein
VVHKLAQLVLVCWYENLLGQVWGWCILEPGLRPHVTNCFATDRSKTVAPRVLTFVNCLWCLFWNWLFYNHALFSSLRFGCLGGGCLLDVTIPNTHVSLFFTIFKYSKIIQMAFFLCYTNSCDVFYGIKNQ